MHLCEVFDAASRPLWGLHGPTTVYLMFNSVTSP